MNRAVLAASALILLAGCSTHAKRVSNDNLGATIPCLSEVRGSEDGTCLQVVRISGHCGSADAVRAEQEWLTRYYPGWVLMHVEHASTGRDQPSQFEDYLHIGTPDGREWDFCFIVMF